MAIARVALLVWGVVFPALADEPELLRTDSRAPYVHRITLYDHDGAAISPTDEPALPYSPRMTCGKCHPYAEIAHGWHFNEPDPTADHGRPGEPWFLVDETTGTVQAISGRGWPGTRTPADIGLTGWQFVKRFGHHTPGGGYGEPSDAEIRESPERLRWGVSGKLEIDCLFCHSADQQHDPAAAAVQIEAENFKWAATVALGLGVVRGEARKASDDWDPMLPPNPDYPDQAGPQLTYDRRHFDQDDRVFFNITRRMPNERCYFCHTTRLVHEERWHVPEDVHLSAGLLCVDCHRHGVDHAITRGFPTEGTAQPRTSVADVDHTTRTMAARAALSCAGCHLGGGGETPTVPDAGRYGAPRPGHEGFPPLHFEKLSCTACHAGPWPEMAGRQFQTALAHGLGLPTRERNADAAPFIFGPVFMREGEAPVGAYRLAAHAGQETRGHGWPMAHDVRPAEQSLGVRGCEDCHALDTPMFAGTPSATADARMFELIEYDPLLARAWALGFIFRPAFKVFAWLCAAVIALVLIRSALDVFYRGVLAAAPAATVACRPGNQGLTFWEHVAHGVAALGILIQACTAFGSELVFGEFSGWALLLHMCGAGLVVLGLTKTALMWAARCRLGALSGLNAAQKWMFWLVLTAGLAVMLPMLLAMLPLFGTDGQEILTEWHFTAAIVLIVALGLHTIVSLAARRRRSRT